MRKCMGRKVIPVEQAQIMCLQINLVYATLIQQINSKIAMLKRQNPRNHEHKRDQLAALRGLLVDLREGQYQRFLNRQAMYDRHRCNITKHGERRNTAFDAWFRSDVQGLYDDANTYFREYVETVLQLKAAAGGQYEVAQVIRNGEPSLAVVSQSAAAVVGVSRNSARFSYAGAGPLLEPELDGAGAEHVLAGAMEFN